MISRKWHLARRRIATTYRCRSKRYRPSVRSRATTDKTAADGHQPQARVIIVTLKAESKGAIPRRVALRATEVSNGAIVRWRWLFVKRRLPNASGISRYPSSQYASRMRPSARRLMTHRNVHQESRPRIIEASASPPRRMSQPSGAWLPHLRGCGRNHGRDGRSI